MIINHLAKKSNISFGTSGIRGLSKNMTFTVCHAYVTAFLMYLEEIGEINNNKNFICIAGDLRPSTKEIMSFVASAIIDKNYKVINCGNIPTPALANYGFQNNIPSIMVTGSHVPFDRNGIKFYKSSGEILKKDEQCILFQDVQLKKNQTINELPKIYLDALELYIERYLSIFPKNCLADKKIGVYQHSAVGRDIIVKVLKELGADVIILGRSDEFIPVDTESIRREDVEFALKCSEEHNLDLIVSTDGDSDRPLISDENGKWIRGDIIGILVSDYLNADSVSTPITSNTALEIANKGKNIFRTKIGSPFVIESMIKSSKNYSRVVGFEANGGFLTGSDFVINNQKLASLPTRDALLPIIVVIELSKKNRSSISKLVNSMPKRFTISDRIQNYSASKSRHLLTKYMKLDVLNKDFSAFFGYVKNIDLTDGIRILFDSTNVLHIRPSGNAPELRVYIESFSTDKALILLKKSIEIILKN